MYSVINLRGVQIPVSTSMLERFPESLLARALRPETGMMPAERDAQGCYIFPRDPDLFRRVILPCYDYGFWVWRDDDNPELIYQELCYWGLAPLPKPEAGDRTSNEASWVGAILSNILPRHIQCISHGNKQLHEVHLCNICKCKSGQSLDVITACIICPDQVRSQALLHGVGLRFNLTRNAAIEWKRTRCGSYIEPVVDNYIRVAHVCIAEEEMGDGPAPLYVELPDKKRADATVLGSELSVQVKKSTGEKYIIEFSREEPPFVIPRSFELMLLKVKDLKELESDDYRYNSSNIIASSILAGGRRVREEVVDKPKLDESENLVLAIFTEEGVGADIMDVYHDSTYYPEEEAANVLRIQYQIM